MKLLKHRKNVDVAYDFLHIENGRYLIAMYNINWAKITGEQPMFLGLEYVDVNRINLDDYEILNFLLDTEKN